MAQDARTPSGPAGATAGDPATIRVAGLYTTDEVLVLIGHDKAAPLCPEFCAPRRVTEPAQASVGERDVLSYTLAAAPNGSKLNADGSRALWAMMEDLPSVASPGQTPSVVTQDEFRPALDPVLAVPTTEQAD